MIARFGGIAAPWVTTYLPDQVSNDSPKISLQIGLKPAMKYFLNHVPRASKNYELSTAMFISK